MFRALLIHDSLMALALWMSPFRIQMESFLSAQRCYFEQADRPANPTGNVLKIICHKRRGRLTACPALLYYWFWSSSIICNLATLASSTQADLQSSDWFSAYDNVTITIGADVQATHPVVPTNPGACSIRSTPVRYRSRV